MIDFPITYFGPISWYSRLLRTENWRIDDTEHYVKQTTRNHCLIATANGVQKLTVPVEKPSRNEERGARIEPLLTREVRLSDHGKWRTEHWNAICTAYGESPFFDYYADDLRPFFERRDWEFLFDYDMAIFEKMLELVAPLTPQKGRNHDRIINSPLSLSGKGKGVGLLLASLSAASRFSARPLDSRPALLHGSRSHPLSLKSR